MNEKLYPYFAIHCETEILLKTQQKNSSEKEQLLFPLKFVGRMRG